MKFDDGKKVARVSLRAPTLLAILNQREAENPTGKPIIINFFSPRLKQSISNRIYLHFRCKIVMASRIWCLYD